MLEHGHQPYGDQAINPRAKQSAYEYYRWMNRAPSLSINAGAYLGNLEREEHILGTNSYPEDHPRHAHVAAGRYYPHGTPLPPEARGEDYRPRASDELRQAAANALEAQPRANRVAATCANCGNPIGPGEGRLARRPSGYVTIHQNET